MSIPQTQYVDLLVKKLYGVAKTDTQTNKSPSNESIASPELNRGDTVWTQANQIPTSAANIANLITQYGNSNPIQCIPDTTTVSITNNFGQQIYPTWLTNVPEWIPQQFGSSYTVKAYVGPANIGNLTGSNVTFISANGEGGGFPGEYFFDYQAGLLNFIGQTIPNVLTTGNVVYITGFVYSGLTGVTNLPSNSNIGNINISNTTISSNNANSLVAFGGTGGIVIPSGTSSQYPNAPAIGTTRFNTTSNNLETWDGVIWVSGGGGGGGGSGSITDQQITPDGVSTTYTLNQPTTSTAVLVSVNGVLQTPGSAYAVTNTQITFASAPMTSDLIDIRFVSYSMSVSSLVNTSGNASVTVSPSGNINFMASSDVVASVTSNEVFNVLTNLQLPVYTTAQSGNIRNAAAGQVIYTTDGNSGNPCLAVYDGTAWKRVVLGSTISR